MAIGWSLLTNKYVLGAALSLGVLGLGYWAFDNWRDNLVEASEKAGFEQAEKQYTKAITAANAKVTEKNKRLDAMNVAFEMLAQRERQNITVKFDPIIKDIRDEVSKDPIYQQCVVSDGMRKSINSGRTTVNSSIDSTTPRRAGSGPSQVEAPTDR